MYLKALAILLTAVSSVAAAADSPLQSRVYDSHGFKSVRVFHTDKSEAGVFIFLKPKKHADDVSDISRRLARNGQLVIEIDPSLFQAPSSENGRHCTNFSDCLVGLSASAQMNLNLPNIMMPRLFSIGDAGEYAETAWREAPHSTFERVISVDYCPKNPTREWSSFEKQTRWTILESSARAANCATLGTALTVIRDLERVPLSANPLVRSRPLLLWMNAQLKPAAKTRERVPSSVPGKIPVDDLQPIVLEPAKTSQAKVTYEAFVILYSGDGGWADFTDELAAEFNRKNIPVVGINSLRYFWRERNPDRGAEDLARLIRHFRDKWGAKTVHLVGFSFGAGTLPFFAKRLDPDMRKSLGKIGLLAPFRKAEFKFFLTDWLYKDERGVDVLPEVRGLAKSITPVCIYPSDEKNVSLCTQDSTAPVKAIELPGGHHFNGATTKVVQTLLEESSSKKEMQR